MPEATKQLGIRWTVGDVSSRGWEALRLSVGCAFRLFGGQTRYAICVNSVPISTALERAGELPSSIEWHEATSAGIPDGLHRHLDPRMAEGVGWKLVPPRIFPERHEIALDNDCILWAVPPAIREFLISSSKTLLAEDVERCLGQFQNSAAPGAINSGIRGLPPGFPFVRELAATLTEREKIDGAPLLLRSELDEQGLQAAALHRSSRCLLVRKEEVSICSPFWPRQQEPGTCGAHFVGLNAKHLPWNYYGEPGDIVRRRHWDAHRPTLYAMAGLELTPPLPLRAT